jgi:hypothetical protein
MSYKNTTTSPATDSKWREKGFSLIATDDPEELPTMRPSDQRRHLMMSFRSIRWLLCVPETSHGDFRVKEQKITSP